MVVPPSEGYVGVTADYARGCGDMKSQSREPSAKRPHGRDAAARAQMPVRRTVSDLVSDSVLSELESLGE